MNKAKPKLIIIRGNSGSGKTVIAQDVRKQSSDKRNLAIISQDEVRRKMLHEHDEVGARNIQIIKEFSQVCLNHGFNVIIEGMLTEERYGVMLRNLISEHHGKTYVYYLDISLEETMKRHTTKPNAHEFGEKELRQWYRKHDFLGVDMESIIKEHESREDIVAKILKETKV